ncbi:MAG: transcription-repair coupling factor [Flavobacteriia bacterium]|nr:transcription-repair coupling factor [Flavobacteriia bacterium]OIP46272.1 MAG: transcription-repair coupling factor [Flavobacteriaceae bacterium CG2_30_31_66]PIV95948.1 MAG: transcription-repair coupling factor [Flavobacteriaceae bacterium CG17_big_fil_post_rev_8_21_14_2_50_31_13]PIX13533.1 MAG: transcription-repair coupling factor [Flavobacteriaceae bacterium CG_4_8_14_3_um_filter_31_8]PIY16283.1 MAG: transcription-repair coupling factor [Flavobacteriaceae bacterium CG_4_10_14_3_um_filter_3
MSLQHIVHQYQKSTSISQVVTALQQEKNHFQISNLAGSSLSFVIAEAFKKSHHPFLLIFDDKEEAAYYLNDLEQLLGDKNVLFFPGSYKRPYAIEETDNANVLLRSEVLNRINSQKKPAIIVTYPTALFEKVVTKKELEKNTLKIAVGESLSLDFVNEVLFEYKFKRVDFVTEPGDFSVRGGIIDVFSFSNDEPYRIEFFGNEIDSIRSFDVETQLSTEKLKKVAIMPNVENKTLQENRESFLTYISPKTQIFVGNVQLLSRSLDNFYAKAAEAFLKLSKEIKHAKPSELFCDGNFIKQQLSDFTLVNFGSNTNETLKQIQSDIKINFNTKPQPSFNKQFHLLIADLEEHHKAGFTNYIFCANEQQAKRFHDIFEDATEKVHYETIVFPLYQGFIDINQKIVCYTDHQIFERYHKFRLKNGYAKKQAITLQELNKLEIGDYVTHMDHGIGKFGGLQKIDVNGKKQEAIKLVYGDRDILYVSIHSLHKISKFNGKDGKPPKIYKLGSGAWKKITQKTKARVKHIAFNLIQLYAKRKLQKGYAFGPDTHMQLELESSFLYEDTPDQFSATQEVKNDMEKEQPMDRLVCGDVGFGKTEVAVRAAFKAVDNGKQVAILVPTTILAFQHFQTFSERLKDFPIKIDYLNRFRTSKEKNEAIEGVNSGAVDIIIGTHQLTNQKLKFKDLGLLIIDEEQKFGVAVKDKLKTLKENVDTLTLTATPIPRTLQFSLMAARDLSVIKTPPPNRHPIESHVIRFSEETIRDAISYEISRGGQVFFIHNRIENIQEVAGLLQRLLPSAKIGIGHGQMEGKKLENLMLSFMSGEFDVLVATTIIESGLDVPNANTIFINNANNFGLSDLHQMRGRVGRSNKKAFCYFITPPYHMMTDDARKRITALEVFSDLGSGINIAMKDLEIRGAGDLLGGEQSGFINDIGFDTYQKILQEAIEELKENEFKDLYPEDENTPKEFVKDVQIDTDFEILFPDEYVNSVTERLSLYNKLGELKTEIELQDFEKQLIDRFGELPSEVDDLLDSVRIKWLAKKLGLEKIILKQKRMVGYFVADQQSNFYQTPVFSDFLKFVQQHAKDCVMKEKETNNGLRLLITFIKIDSVKKALETINKFKKV